MSSNQNDGWTRGQIGIFWIFIYAVIGASIVIANQDSEPQLDQTLKILLLGPSILFIAPPGWAILAWIASKLNNSSKASVEHFQQHSDSSGSDCEEVTPVLSSLSKTNAEKTKSVEVVFAESLTKDLVEKYQTILMNAQRDSDEVSDEIFGSYEFAKKVADKFNWKCQKCLFQIEDGDWRFNSSNIQRLIIQHIVAPEIGGKNSVKNARPIHARCLSEPSGQPKHSSAQSYSTTLSSFRSNPSAHIPSSNNNRSSGFSTSKPRAIYEVSDRLGDWISPHRVINQLMKELNKARISETQKERAREFLMADHVNDLMQTCQRGHRMSLENTYFSRPADGYIQRQCRACRRLSR
jgi:hypothetical protein